MARMTIQRGTSPRVIDYQIRGSHFAYHRGLGSYSDMPYGLGQSVLQTGLSVASTAASFVPVVGPILGGVIGLFGKIFGGGKSKAQKKAESIQRRKTRAAGTMQAVANVLVNYPNSVENRIMGKLDQLFTVGAPGDDWAQGAPCEAIDAFLSIDPAVFQKTRAISAMKAHQTSARNFLTGATGWQCFRGQQWWDKYLLGQLTKFFGPVDQGYQRLMEQSYKGPVIDIAGRWIAGSNQATIIQTGSNFTVQIEGVIGKLIPGKFTAQDKITVDSDNIEATGTATMSSIVWDGGLTWQRDTGTRPVTVTQAGAPTVIAPSGGAPAVVSTPTTDGQAQITPAGPIQAGLGDGLGLLLGGGLLLLAFGGKKQRKRQRRPARGTTIIRRY